MTLLRPVRFEQIWLMLIGPLVAVVLVGVLESRSVADGLPRLLILHANGLMQIKNASRIAIRLSPPRLSN